MCCKGWAANSQLFWGKFGCSGKEKYRIVSIPWQLKPCITPFWHLVQHFHWSLATQTVNLLMWGCVWSPTLTWLILSAKSCPINAVPAEAGHLLSSRLFWVSREGNHTTVATETTDGLLISLNMMLRNILIIPRKWVHLIRSRSRLLAERWLPLEHFHNKSQVLWCWNTAEFPSENELSPSKQMFSIASCDKSGLRC